VRQAKLDLKPYFTTPDIISTWKITIVCVFLPYIPSSGHLDQMVLSFLLRNLVDFEA